MIFKRERLLIRIAAILGAVGIIMVALLYLSINLLKTMPEMQDAIESSGQQLSENNFTTTYYILTILSILVVVALFVIASKLSIENYRMMGFILIGIAVVSYWLLWFIPIILIIIAAILVLNKGKNHHNTNEIVDQI